ncbi:hypothetical protein T492DRAFT_868985 [Pavlovales sp. CCMP2436]|nr:hypothetical protein T492DRAFT_868985 [Pavlovales sp. CCMP2436]
MGSASSIGRSSASVTSTRAASTRAASTRTSPEASPSASSRPSERKSYSSHAAAAYNDANGCPSFFTFESLAHVNLVAGTDFDLDDFRHVSEWYPSALPAIDAINAHSEIKELREELREQLQSSDDENVQQVMLLLRKLVRITAVANAAMVKFQGSEAAGLRAKYGKQLVPSSLIELLKGPRSPTDWDEIDDLLCCDIPDWDVAERRLGALADSLLAIQPET